MKLTKESLETMYSTMSINDMAQKCNMSKSTLYYHMRKFGIQCRSKSEAQNKHLEHSSHQRVGKSHSDEAKNRISDGTRKFWDSSDGQDQKQKLGELRKSEWKSNSPKQRLSVLNRLQSGDKPSPGKLSRFGKKLADFLYERETVKTGIKLTPNHVSDIILEERGVVIELLLPTYVYGEQQEQKIEARYDKLTEQLNDAGYRVMIIEDQSNSISNARCQRVYDALNDFLQNTNPKNVTIVS